MDNEDKFYLLKHGIWSVRNDVIAENLPTLPNVHGLSALHAITFWACSGEDLDIQD